MNAFRIQDHISKKAAYESALGDKTGFEDFPDWDSLSLTPCLIGFEDSIMFLVVTQIEKDVSI